MASIIIGEIVFAAAIVFCIWIVINARPTHL
jgi:hypothetical protein